MPPRREVMIAESFVVGTPPDQLPATCQSPLGVAMKLSVLKAHADAAVSNSPPITIPSLELIVIVHLLVITLFFMTIHVLYRHYS
ncbi:MAG: hypothetical protein Q7J98_14430 [Kiritimatiellia bacterium]|nr:hypothetical protein [Kiritimatiellia bacterium]